MRRMTSEPVPLPHMIGSSPAIITATVYDAAGHDQCVRRFNESMQGPRPSIHSGIPPVTVDMPRRNVQSRTMVPSAWFCDMPHTARASCTLDLSRRDRRPAPARWNKVARVLQSIAALPSRCPAQQFQMLWRCWRPVRSPTIAPETPTRRCVLPC
jgi:hypothetical protein